MAIAITESIFIHKCPTFVYFVNKWVYRLLRRSFLFVGTGLPRAYQTNNTNGTYGTKKAIK